MHEHRKVETCGVPFVQHLMRARAIEDGGMGAAGTRKNGRGPAEEEGEGEEEGADGEDDDETFRFPCVGWVGRLLVGGRIASIHPLHPSFQSPGTPPRFDCFVTGRRC